jgi:dihydroorotase
MGLPTPQIAVGAPANLCLVDLAASWQVGEAGYESRSENCCFAGRELHGKVLLTVAAGAVAFRERAFSLSEVSGTTRGTAATRSAPLGVVE